MRAAQLIQRQPNELLSQCQPHPLPNGRATARLRFAFFLLAITFCFVLTAHRLLTTIPERCRDFANASPAVAKFPNRGSAFVETVCPVARAIVDEHFPFNFLGDDSFAACFQQERARVNFHVTPVIDSELRRVAGSVGEAPGSDLLNEEGLNVKCARPLPCSACFTLFAVLFNFHYASPIYLTRRIQGEQRA